MFALNVTKRFEFSSGFTYWVVVSLIALISVCLLLGFLTIAVSIIACLAALVNLFVTDGSMDVVYVLRILTSAALFFLGPGAYSVDARLFGLRVTVVPPRKNKSSVN